MAFRVCSLASGSSGNAFLVETPEGAILVDAGLSAKQMRLRAQQAGLSLDRMAAVVVTHDHRDHSTGAGVAHRAFKGPLVMSRGTWAAVGSRLGPVASPHFVAAGATLRAAGAELSFHGTPHDGREPLCVVVERGGRRCGFLTDLGHPFDGLGPLLSTLDAVFLESNYQDGLLDANPEYPPELKRRIRGRRGHLENRETGALLRDFAGERLRVVVLSHLSEGNNRPDLARAEVLALAGDVLARRGARLFVAPRHAPSAVVNFHG